MTHSFPTRLSSDLWRSHEERINSLNDDLTEHARADEAASRLTSIPGIGVLGATALVAAVGDGEAFRRARDIPAWLGLVPKQMMTGGKPRLLSIPKRGNTYLRMLLIHGARAALPSHSQQATPSNGRRSGWESGCQYGLNPVGLVPIKKKTTKKRHKRKQK